MKMTRKILALVLALALALALTACGGGDKSESTATAEPTGVVVVYSPHDADPLNAGVNEFMTAYPGIEVQVVAAGTGELLARIKAEAENPQCDVLWGGGADSLAAYKDYFEAYVSTQDEFIADAYKDVDDKWIGESPLPMVIFYNKTLVAEDEVPKTWEDLTNEKWKGQIAFADPAKSGSAYTQLCTMLFAFGGPEGGGWDYVTRFIANLDGKIQSSSGNCHKLVADGEYAIGVTLEKSTVQYAGNDNVAYIFPEDGTSAVPDGVAIVKGAPNMENAKLFVDYVLGADCQTNQNKDWGRRPVRTDLAPEGLCAITEIKLVDYDFAYAANNKEAIVEKWQELVVG